MNYLPAKSKDSRIQIISHPTIDPRILAEWAIERLPEEDLASVGDIGPFQAFGVIRKDENGVKPMAVVLFNWFREMRHGNDMRVIIVSEDPKWCLPGVLRELFSYPFEIAGCERLTAIIRDGNKKSLRLCQGLGFRKEGTLRRAHDGKTNAIVLSMLKQECKWLKRSREIESETNGQEIAFSSGATGPAKNNRSAKRRKQRSAARERADQRG